MNAAITFDNVIESEHVKRIENIVTPLTPYVICNHFVSTEVHDSEMKDIDCPLELSANDLRKNQNYQDIKHLDIIQVQVDLFDFFYDEILPVIAEKKIQVIVLTSQWRLPQMQQSEKTDKLLDHDTILLWISQNPIPNYTHHKKYMPFPYGIHHENINEYIDFVKSYDTQPQDKTTKILNQFSSVHNHLPGNHIRRMYGTFGVHSGNSLNYTDYLTNISNAEFVISTSGDRDDCYRHYECIGLNAIPVSNIADGYKGIFEENMVYSHAEEMLNSVNTQMVNYEYKKPNRDVLTVSHWVNKINERIQCLVSL